MELVVADTQGVLDAGGALALGDGLQSVGGALEIALLAVETGKVEDDLLRVGVNLASGLELGIGFSRVVIEAVELPEEEMGLNVVGLELSEPLVLGDGKLKHLRGLGVLGIAKGAEIDLAEELVGCNVIGVTGDLVLCGGDCFANTADLEVEFGETVLDEVRGRVGGQSELVFLYGLSGVVRSTGIDGKIFIKVRQAVVIVGGRTIR
jgi:hypothetical protein